jgi:hypothetical protein
MDGRLSIRRKAGKSRAHTNSRIEPGINATVTVRRQEQPATRNPPLKETVMDTGSKIESLIRTKVCMVDFDKSRFGLLSTGRIAVALVLDRPDLLKFWGTMLDAVDRLGPEWTRAAPRVQRDGWDGQF